MYYKYTDEYQAVMLVGMWCNFKVIFVGVSVFSDMRLEIYNVCLDLGLNRIIITYYRFEQLDISAYNDYIILVAGNIIPINGVIYILTTSTTFYQTLQFTVYHSYIKIYHILLLTDIVISDYITSNASQIK